ncbi:MAG: hypothetical protein ACP5HM_12045 [Anaerolineae bacterium]
MVTKRQLGFVIIAVGVLLLLAAVVVDLVGAGGWGEFGPLQWLAVGLGALALVAGVPLVRLGDRPA